MKVFELVIEPISPYGTVLKGDTIFGHFCWQAAEDETILAGGFDHWLAQYAEKPFAVFSSAWPVFQAGGEKVYAIAKPAALAVGHKSLQSATRKQKLEIRKAEKKRKWLLIGQDLRIDPDGANLRSDAELFSALVKCAPPEMAGLLHLVAKEYQKPVLIASQPHNSINRLTMTTGTGPFAPFSHENHHYLPGMKLAIFVGVNEDALSEANLLKGIDRIGAWGFGRDASTGLGKFKVNSITEIMWPRAEKEDMACLTVGPAVPEKGVFSHCYGLPFTRFGRHGSALACSRHPFKKPVVMADDASVMVPLDRAVFEKPYLGIAIKDISAVDMRTVMQGYSLYLPYGGKS